MLHLDLVLSAIRVAGGWLSHDGKTPEHYRVALLGARNAGKTQLTYRLCGGGHRVPEPTQGIHETTLELDEDDGGGRRVTLVEVGGAVRLLPVWSHLLRAADAVIFVVDFADPASWQEARDRLQNALLADRSFAEARAPLLLVAAKADAAGHGWPVVRLVRELGLCRVRNHRWHLQVVAAARRPPEEAAAVETVKQPLGRALRSLLRLVDENRRRLRSSARAADAAAAIMAASAVSAADAAIDPDSEGAAARLN